MANLGQAVAHSGVGTAPRRELVPPLVLIAAAWALGLLLAHHLLVQPGALLIIGSVPLAAAVLWWRDRPMRLAAVCALAFLGGALRYQAALPNQNDPTFIARYNDQGWTTVEGVVRGYPDVRDTWVNLRLEADQVQIGDRRQAVHGLVLVRAPRLPEVRYGDRLQVSGQLETPPVLEDFDYREYLARQGIYAYVGRPRIEIVGRGEGSPVLAALYSARDRARALIARMVPEPEASLLQGILLGIRGAISRDLYDQFNATGTSHILVISGSNITIIVALFWSGFSKLVGRRRAYWLTVAGIAGYVAFVGGEAAVARAGLMGGLFVTALYLGRWATAYVSLAASGLLLTVISPLALWDPGFQLSFAATLSLILFTRPIQRLLERGLIRVVEPERANRLMRLLQESVVVTLAAQVLTLPVVLLHFGRLSLVGLLANPLVLFAQPAIMIVGGLATLAGLVPALAPAAQALFWVAWLGLAYTVAVVRGLAAWPLAFIAVSPGRAARLAIYYGALLLAACAAARLEVRRLWKRAFARPGRAMSVALLAPPLAAAALLGIAAWQQPDGRLHVAFLDVGEGDAILVTTPLGQQILVDGGPSPAALAAGLGPHMPFWDRSIDRVIMTHADADHLTGLAEALRRYRVGGWLDSGDAQEGVLYRECVRLMDRNGVPRQAVDAGDQIDLGGGAVLQVLNPMGATSGTVDKTDGNDRSVVVRIAWRQTELLLTGDAGAGAEAQLIRSGQPLAAQVLKVGHHGSDSSSGPGFLAAVAPRYAVVSVGADNHFGHPAPAAIDRLSAAGTTVLRTDQVGTIEFVTDGQSWWIKTDR